ncbi:hypothetical protein C8D88_12364 [Lentzea atacamensis]|uniref:Uncharacterized protein n=1 Tax=Lentzea atacamensis TaxID=531938 RepID=A0A316HKY7_9PSEU|nr:hypothetical protein C8D88_12364 [Lentzea atacamensis]
MRRRAHRGQPAGRERCKGAHLRLADQPEVHTRQLGLWSLDEVPPACVPGWTPRSTPRTTRKRAGSPSSTPKLPTSLARTRHQYGWPACTHWNASGRTTPTNGRPSPTCGAPTSACPTPLHPRQSPIDRAAFHGRCSAALVDAPAFQRPDCDIARPPDSTTAHAEAVLERDVRLSVQRLLATHLRPHTNDNTTPHRDYWPEMARVSAAALGSMSRPLPARHRVPEVRPAPGDPPAAARETELPEPTGSPRRIHR